MFLLNVHRISAVGDEQSERYGCPEPGKLYDLVTINSCQCDAAHRYIFLERNGSPTKVKGFLTSLRYMRSSNEH